MEFNVKQIFPSEELNFSEMAMVANIARGLYIMGDQLSISEQGIVPACKVTPYFEYISLLVEENVLTHADHIQDLGMVNSQQYEKYDLDIAWFKDFPVFREDEEEFFWSYSYAEKNYTGHGEYVIYRDLDITLEAVVGYYLALVLRGDVDKKLHIKLSDDETRSTYIYLTILSALRRSKFMREHIILDMVEDNKVDLDYLLFCHDAQSSNTNHFYTIHDKLKWLDKLNFRQGGIYYLFEITNRSTSNPMGMIKNCHIVRLEEVGTEKVFLSQLSCHLSKEEIYEDFVTNMPPQEQEHFLDVLDFKITAQSSWYPLYNMGINTYFESEDYLLCPIDINEEVFGRRLYIDGSIQSIDLMAVDFIYILLKQYNISFNEELYRTMYLSDHTPVYDVLNLNTGNFEQHVAMFKHQVRAAHRTVITTDEDGYDVYGEVDISVPALSQENFYDEDFDLDEFEEELSDQEMAMSYWDAEYDDYDE